MATTPTRRVRLGPFKYTRWPHGAMLSAGKRWLWIPWGSE